MIGIPSIVRDPLYLYSALVGWLRRRPLGHGAEVRSIVIYKFDHMGDLLMATPALRAIRKHYPEAHITIVLGEWNLPIIEGNPNVDRVVVFNSPRFTRAPYTPHHHRELRRSLSDQHPDLVIGLRDDWVSLTASLFSGARRLERGSVHLKEWIRRRRNGGPQSHEIDRIWGVLAPAGIPATEDRRLDLILSDEEKEEGRDFLLKEGIEPGFIAIQAGATVPLREWNVARFAEVARNLAADHPGELVLIGAPSEKERSRELYEKIADLRPVDITGRRSVRQLGAILRHAGLYIGSDGGAMHIATAAGAPTVALFGPGPYHGFYPVGRDVVAVSHHFPCAPCHQITCIRPEATCMMAITVDDVLAGVRQLREKGEL